MKITLLHHFWHKKNTENDSPSLNLCIQLHIACVFDPNTDPIVKNSQHSKVVNLTES